MGKTRRAFDITTPAQEAALASLDAHEEIRRRRELNARGRDELAQILRDAGYEPVGPSLGNFLYADVGEDAQPLFDALLRQGVIVRPLAGFGAPAAIRVTVGTSEEHAFLTDALARLKTTAPAS
jgi:histidinol-phosphate aminotransferase